MDYQERLIEARKLERDNQALLSTPLMSEGSISPMQVGLFSAKAKARWQKNTMAKMELEYIIKQLRRTDEEITCANQRKEAKLEDERLATIAILNNKIDFIHGLGVMSHKKNGELKPLYQKTVDGYQLEITNCEVN